MIQPWEYKLSFEPHPFTLRTIRKLSYWAGIVGGATEEDARDIELAVGVILNNARVQGYDQGVGPVEMKVEFDGDKLAMLVTNHGHALTRQTDIPAMRPTERGEDSALYLAGQLMDSVEVTPDSQGNGVAVRMRKTLPQVEHAHAGRLLGVEK